MSLISFPVRDQIWSTIATLAGFVTERENSWLANPAVGKTAPSQDESVLKVVAALGDACAALGAYDADEKELQSHVDEKLDIRGKQLTYKEVRAIMDKLSGIAGAAQAAKAFGAYCVGEGSAGVPADPVDRLSSADDAKHFLFAARGLHKHPDNVDWDVSCYIDGEFDVIKDSLERRLNDAIRKFRAQISSGSEKHKDQSRTKFTMSTQIRLVDELIRARDNPASGCSFVDRLVGLFVGSLNTALCKCDVDRPTDDEVFWPDVKLVVPDGMHDDFRSLLYTPVTCVLSVSEVYPKILEPLMEKSDEENN